MFQIIFVVFAMHHGVPEPLKAFSMHEPFPTEAACNASLNSKDGKQHQAHILKVLAKQKLKAKFACEKIEEEKSEDDGSI
jgi:hypothetical protein